MAIIDCVPNVERINLLICSAHLTKQSCLDLVLWLFDTCVTIYASTERKNDFFLLHGVTASWSFCQVAPLLEPEVIYTCFRAFMAGLLATYLAQGAEEIKMPDDASLGSDAEWRQLIADVVAVDKDEHVFKLVQVCFERWQQQKGSGKEGIYFAAAKIANEWPLTFNM